jgi:hypothetical protein
MAFDDSTEIRVPVDLEGAGPHINGHASAMAEELARLSRQLEPLRETWRESGAKDDYAARQAEWDMAADGLFGPEGVLPQIAQAMHVNWLNYVDTESSNVRTWQR